MKNNAFQFKQFAVKQDNTAMKIGTDSILLGAWAELSKAKTILDIGTGTGVLALIAAQNNKSARIHAVEADRKAYEQARQNFLLSEWNARIHIFHIKIQDFIPPGNIMYDTIICNPPYYTSGILSYEESRNIARHTVCLSHEELFYSVCRLLSPSGSFYCIVPDNEDNAFRKKAEKLKLFATNMLRVRTRKDIPVKRILLKFESKHKNLAIGNLTVYTEKSEYSNAFKTLTKDFYLYIIDEKNV